jgi:glycine dehydrogenase subunit 1
MRNTRALAAALTELPGVDAVFEGAFFHECVLRLPVAVPPVLEKLAARGIVGGFELSTEYPELGHVLLVCATETRTAADIIRYRAALAEVLAAANAA